MSNMMHEISLRGLKLEDSIFMLEWMHDEEISGCFKFDTRAMTLQDCMSFITRSQTNQDSLHFAIVDDSDEYLGTVSLKNIDKLNKQAEYAISTRKKAHGKGVALQATKMILQVAFENIHLNRVYLNVLKSNFRANIFYRKAGFIFERCEVNSLEIKGKYYDLNWFYMDVSRFNRTYNN